jgi:hypothetical protein
MKIMMMGQENNIICMSDNLQLRRSTLPNYCEVENPSKWNMANLLLLAFAFSAKMNHGIEIDYCVREWRY